MAVKDAVLDFSHRHPLRKRGELSIVSGQTSYSLPADFHELTQLQSLLTDMTSGVLNTPTGLIPISDTYKEEYEIADETITFYPTPNYTATRHFWYRAVYLLDGSSDYPALDDFSASIVIKKASAICLRLQANKAAQEAWSFAIGDERVDKTKLSETLAKRASELESDYLAGIKDVQKGANILVGRRSDYSAYR